MLFVDMPHISALKRAARTQPHISSWKLQNRNYSNGLEPEPLRKKQMYISRGTVLRYLATFSFCDSWKEISVVCMYTNIEMKLY